jgi:hypothetical protein
VAEKAEKIKCIEKERAEKAKQVKELRVRSIE